MIKFKTQFRKSKEGNVHFAFLGISFNKNQYMIIVLGIVVIINLNQNKMSITKNVTSKIDTNKVLLKIRKGKLDRIRINYHDPSLVYNLCSIHQQIVRAEESSTS